MASRLSNLHPGGTKLENFGRQFTLSLGQLSVKLSATSNQALASAKSDSLSYPHLLTNLIILGGHYTGKDEGYENKGFDKGIYLNNKAGPLDACTEGGKVIITHMSVNCP